MRTETRVMIPTMLEAMAPGAMVDAIMRFSALIRAAGGDADLSQGMIPVVERIFLHSEEMPRRVLLEEARGNRQMADFLISTVFPGVARTLDSGWTEDRLSFVDVTIAATRLQDAVRSLGRFSLPAIDLDALLMIVPQWEQHGLPAVFAAERLRQRGAPTNLLTGLGARELVGITSRIAPKAILISSGSYRSLARVPELARTLRRGVPRAIPIILGGPAITSDIAGTGAAGADLATNDLNEALSFCDFPLSQLADHMGTSPA